MARLALEILGEPVTIVLLRGRREEVPEQIYSSKLQKSFVCNGSRGVDCGEKHVIKIMRELFEVDFGPFPIYSSVNTNSDLVVEL